MMQYYIFAGFIGLMLFALLFWYKRTPRARLPRREAEEIAEKEAKLFRLYQSLEDMMDSFESYVEQQSAQFGKAGSDMAAAEKRVDELAERIEAALLGSEQRWEEAAQMLDKTELLATELTDRMSRGLDELQRRRQQALESVDELQQKRQQAAEKPARKAQPDIPFRPIVEAPKVRKLEPIVARPAEPSEAQKKPAEASAQAIEAATAATGETTRAVVHRANTQPLRQANEVQAQLIKKLAEAKKNRQARQEYNQAGSPRFEATVPEFDITTDMAMAVNDKYPPTYSRPAPMKQGKAERVDYPPNEEQSRKQQVINLYNEGMTAEDISRQLGVAKGAISFILDLQGKLQ